MNSRMTTVDTKCPITHNLITELQDPVQARDGHIYERTELLKWVRQTGKSPVRPEMHLDVQEIENAPTVYGLLGGTKTSVVAPPAPSHEHGAFIVVLDTSGSMGASARTSDGEDHGLSNLDVAKHAIRTYAHCLKGAAGGACGYLEVHTFSTVAKNIFPMQEMTTGGIADLEKAMKMVRASGTTNLWAAISQGIARAVEWGGCPVFLLTDGVATVIPPRGHDQMMDKLIAKLHKEGKSIPSLRCLGFGEDIDSAGLQRLAHKTNSSFIYIPDVGFVGTATQHLLANTLVSTPPVETDDAANIRLSMVQVLTQIMDKSMKPANPGRQWWTASDESVDPKGLIEASTLWHSFTASSMVPKILKEEQIEFALEPQYMKTWGRHYLRSLADAFLFRECINFKDASLQDFGRLRDKKWQEILDHADTIYCQIPPPIPSRVSLGRAKRHACLQRHSR